MLKMRRLYSKLMSVFLCIVFLCMAFPCTALAAENADTVRVGFFAFDGYHMQDEDGNRSGYGYELLQHMAGYAGFRYEYVGYENSWAEMQDMLENGEIDILTSAQKTDERLERFDFSELSIGRSAAMLTTRIGEHVYLPDEYLGWNGIRVGMIENNSRNDGFARFAEEHGFSYQPFYFQSVEEMLAALKDEKSVDAALTSDLRRIDGESVLVKFDYSSFYVIVKKGNTELLERVNYALQQMDIYEAGFRTMLHNKYYPTVGANEIQYSAEERAYIEQMRDTAFTGIISPDRIPYSFVQDGALTGSMYDAAMEVIARSGLNIELVVPKDRAEYWRLVNEGAVDIRFDAALDYNRAEISGNWLTPSYIEVPVARLYREDAKAFDSAAVVRNSDLATYYSDTLTSQGIPITYYDSVTEVADAVLSGRQSMGVLSLNTAAIAVRDDETNRLTSELMYGASTFYTIAVSNEQSPLLYSIIKKAAASISQQELDAFSLNYADTLEKPFSLVGFIYDHPVGVVLMAVGFIFVVLLIVGLFYMMKRRKAVQAQMETEKRRSEELAEALERARLADAAKSVFMSRMSHEIRTPLNAIIGYNTIARSDMTEAKTDVERRQADMKVMDCLTKSDIASRHLLTIINDVLDMSAIESGKLKIAQERFDFKGLIASLTTVFYTQAQTKGVDLKVVFDSLTEEWFVGDQLRTNQILTKLLSNAVKFTTADGEVRLHVQQTDTDDKTAHIRFEISDTGIGMDQEFLDNIWSPFEQADASIARRFGGTGLGLSITRSLVELMGGTIAVKSEPGNGSVFTVELAYERTEQPHNEGGLDFGAVNALVVDDDISTCDYIRLLFNRFGARSTAVTSGQEAITAFTKAIEQGEPYTVCLVDWRMPKMDGLETVRRLRDIAGADIPIIVITAYDFSEIADKAAEIGVSTFISKPLFQSSLFNLLANICGRPMAAKREKTEAFDFGAARVLLAEDNKMNMEIAQRILESANLVVDCAWNGREAVDKFMSEPSGTYKAILMDIQMPVMDGHEATRVIRASAHPEAGTMPIIAMTADAFAENVAEARAAGMNAHIAKPIILTNLFETLSEYIKS